MNSILVNTSYCRSELKRNKLYLHVIFRRVRIMLYFRHNYTRKVLNLACNIQLFYEALSYTWDLF